MSRLGNFRIAADLCGALASVAWLIGCHSRSTQPEFKGGTHAIVKWDRQDHPVVGGTSAHYGLWGEGMAYVVWTDRTASWGGGGGAERKADKAHADFRAFQTPTEGPRVEFRYEMNETSGGEDYDQRRDV